MRSPFQTLHPPQKVVQLRPSSNAILCRLIIRVKNVTTARVGLTWRANFPARPTVVQPCVVCHASGDTATRNVLGPIIPCAEVWRAICGHSSSYQGGGSNRRYRCARALRPSLWTRLQHCWRKAEAQRSWSWSRSASRTLGAGMQILLPCEGPTYYAGQWSGDCRSAARPRWKTPDGVSLAERWHESQAPGEQQHGHQGPQAREGVPSAAQGAYSGTPVELMDVGIAAGSAAGSRDTHLCLRRRLLLWRPPREMVWIVGELIGGGQCAALPWLSRSHLLPYTVTETAEGRLQFDTESEAAYPQMWCVSYAQGLHQDFADQGLFESFHHEGRVRWIQKELNKATSRLQEVGRTHRASRARHAQGPWEGPFFPHGPEGQYPRHWPSALPHFGYGQRGAPLPGLPVVLEGATEFCLEAIRAHQLLGDPCFHSYASAPSSRSPLAYIQVSAHCGLLRYLEGQFQRDVLHLHESISCCKGSPLWTWHRILTPCQGGPYLNGILLTWRPAAKSLTMPDRTHLRFAGLQGRTLGAYSKALDLFLQFLQQQDVTLHHPKSLDVHLAEYINILYQEGEALSAAGHLLSAIKQCIPEFKAQLPRSAQFHRNWCPGPCYANPSWAHGRSGFVSLIHGTAGFVRPSHPGFQVFSPNWWDAGRPVESPFACQRQCINLVLPFSKTSDGNPQVLRIEDPSTIQLINFARGKYSPRSFLWPHTLQRFHRTWKQMIRCLGFHASDDSPYGIRRGGATAFYLDCGDLDAAVSRGRWSNSRTAKLYIDDGALALSEMNWTGPQRRRVRRWAKKFLLWYTSLRKKVKNCCNGSGSVLFLRVGIFHGIGKWEVFTS